MSMSTRRIPEQPLRGAARFGSPAIWFTFLGGPLAWTAHFLVTYGFIYVACGSGSPILLYAATIVAAPVALGASVVGWRLWRRPGSDEDSTGEQGRARTRFFGLAGFLISVVFLLAILFEGASPLFLHPCGGAT